MKTFAMKTFALFLLMLALGVAGLIFVFGDCQSLIKLVLSKPIGMLLIAASYRLHCMMRESYKKYISTH